MVYAVTFEGVRIGSVMSFAGNPKSQRWVAYSIHGEAKRSFPTRRAATEWLGDHHQIFGGPGRARTDKS